jgi:DNA polymerase-3 subunit alpha
VLNVLENEQLDALASHKASPAYGLHAAGVLITPDEYTAGCVPLMYVSSSQTMATQFYKDDVEALGLVKLDLIGSKTATAVKIACELAGVSPAEFPLNDKKTFAALRAGKVTGVFQLEGGTNARVTKQVKPRTVKDIIDIVTLGRPAVLDSGATDAYVSRRHGKSPTPPRHQIIVEETKDTYGVILYQEQALSVMKRLGLTVEEMEKARKAIKASNEYIGNARKVMKDLREKISAQAVQVGMTPADIEWLNGALDAYSGYGFNKAHSTSYGVMAYITAYLRANHPVAFWAGTLAAYESSTSEVWYGPPGRKVKIKQIVAYKKEAVEDGVTILPPHVNRSAAGFKAEPDLSAVRTGLLSIDQVGEKAATELVANAPYTDLADLAARVSARIVSGSKALGKGHSLPACGGVITALAKAGALDGLAPVPPPPPKKTRRKPQEEVLL